MNTTWFITGLFFFISIILLRYVGPFKGSVNSDFPENLQPENNPLPSCPNSPNCVRITTCIKIDNQKLFEILPSILEQMNAERIKSDSQILQITAIFRIPVFGFKDDMMIKIEPNNTHSLLHLTSRSRIGHGDLGVNRRRLKTFLRILNSYLNLT